MDDLTARDIIEADRYSVDELRAAVFDGSGSLSRPLALSLLRQKDYPNKVEDLESLLTTEGEDPRIRSLAGQLLGDVRSPDAMQALERGLETRDDLTLRGVILGLTGAGRNESIPALRRLAKRKGPIGDAAAKAVTLLSHRSPATEQPSDGSDPPDDAETEDEAPAHSSVHIEAMSEEGVGRALEDLVRAVPNVALSKEGAIAVRRGTRTFLFFPNKEVVDDLSSLTRGAAQLGVVAVPREREGTGWEAKFHILTEPAGDDLLTIVVLSAGGRSLLKGLGRVKGEEIDFDVKSVDRPGAALVRVRGAYDGRAVRIEDADVELRARVSAPSPGQHVRAV